VDNFQNEKKEYSASISAIINMHVMFIYSNLLGAIFILDELELFA